jgi:uncharacterized protein
MSKVLVISDSHGLTTELSRIKDKHEVEVDLLLHCGDSELPANDPALEGFIVVRGNCDFDEDFPEDSVQIVGDRKIMITHGHRDNVKSTLTSLSYRAQELDAKIVCFGHSHILGAEMQNGILFLNPGSIRLPRQRKEKTYCILELMDDKIILNVYDINLGLLTECKCEFILTSL